VEKRDARFRGRKGGSVINTNTLDVVAKTNKCTYLIAQCTVMGHLKWINTLVCRRI
jgi:hypothetical protein